MKPSYFVLAILSYAAAKNVGPYIRLGEGAICMSHKQCAADLICNTCSQGSSEPARCMSVKYAKGVRCFMLGNSLPPETDEAAKSEEPPAPAPSNGKTSPHQNIESSEETSPEFQTTHLPGPGEPCKPDTCGSNIQCSETCYYPLVEPRKGGPGRLKYCTRLEAAHACRDEARLYPAPVPKDMFRENANSKWETPPSELESTDEAEVEV